MVASAGRLFAACGLYCGACYHYRAGRPDGGHLLSEAARGGRPLAGYMCDGCRSDRQYVHPGCRDCRLRACASARGLAHCGLCPDLPCEQLVAFRLDGRKHHRPIVDALRAATRVGVDRWLASQERRWRCPSCGRPFSWYESVCAGCGGALDSYGVDEPI